MSIPPFVILIFNSSSISFFSLYSFGSKLTFKFILDLAGTSPIFLSIEKYFVFKSSITKDTEAFPSLDIHKSFVIDISDSLVVLNVNVGN